MTYARCNKSNITLQANIESRGTVVSNPALNVEGCQFEYGPERSETLRFNRDILSLQENSGTVP
jgi:hypothetical protein